MLKWSAPVCAFALLLACGPSAKQGSESASQAPAAAQESTEVASTPESEELASSAPDPIVTPATREEMGEQTLAMLVELTGVAEQNAGDCAATTAAFRATLERYAESMAAGARMEENPEDRQWFEENYSYKINNQVMFMREHLGACMEDPEFQKVLDTIK